MEWTDAANEELNRYFEAIRADLADSGADPDEVINDMRRHIGEELSIMTACAASTIRLFSARLTATVGKASAEPRRPSPSPAGHIATAASATAIPTSPVSAMPNAAHRIFASRIR